MTAEARDVNVVESRTTSLHVSRFTFYDYLLALLAGLLAFVLYLRTLAPGLLFGDSAEFQMAAWLGGFVHPTGYPLYLLLGYVWTHLLTAGDPAWRMNLLSAVWGGVASGLVYLLAHRIVALWLRPGEGASPAVRLAALFAALAFAVTPTFWAQAVIAEVYTLNTAFVAAVLLGLTTWAAQPAGQAEHHPALLDCGDLRSEPDPSSVHAAAAAQPLPSTSGWFPERVSGPGSTESRLTGPSK